MAARVARITEWLAGREGEMIAFLVEEWLAATGDGTAARGGP